MNNYDQYYQQYCNKLDLKNLRRSLDCYDNENYIDFSTNDYLNFSHNSELKKAASLSAIKYDIGSTGSRLLSGNKKIFTQLEINIAKDKNTESALIYNSGFHANLSVLSGLLQKKVLKQQPLVFFDKLNHASLYQAIFLSDVQLIRYKHQQNFQELENFLEKFSHSSQPKFIVSETVFGMDGDKIDLTKLLFLAKKFNCFLYLDEAHATGIWGKNGYGLTTEYDFSDVPHVVMGTFSKALGCYGAYIACSHIVKDYLINSNVGLIYTTSLPPMLVNIMYEAWLLVKKVAKERSNLLHLANYLRQELQELKIDIGPANTNIIPIILHDEKKTLEAQHLLQKNNILVSAIRPPSVPLRKSRLRLALTIKHTKQDIDTFLYHLQKII